MTDPHGHAVLKISGPPGSGKTRELAREAVRLHVEEGLPAASIRILALTGLNAARLKRYLYQEAELAGIPVPAIRIQQWEGFCRELFGPALSHPELLSNSEAAFLLYGLIKAGLSPSHPLYYAAQSPALAREAYELFRRLLLEPDKAARFTALPAEGRVAELQGFFSQFRQKVKAANLLTFPELLHRGAMLAEENAALGQGVSALLVDEANELSGLHYRLLQALAPATRLVLVGSDHLSIRAYRGALPERFIKLGDSFHRIVHLPRQACMRGNESILELLNRWKTLDLTLWESRQPEGLDSQMMFGRFADPVAEANALADWVLNLRKQQPDLTFSDFVILLRSAQYRTVLLDVLTERGIPFSANGFSDSLRQCSQALHDGLRFCEALDALAWDGVRTTASLFTIERQRWIEVANHHLQRLLLSDCPAWSKHEALLRARTILENPEDLLITALRQTESLPAETQERISTLLRLVRSFQQNRNAAQLLQALVDWCGLSDSSLRDRIQVLLEQVRQLEKQHSALHQTALPLADLLMIYETLWQEGSQADPNAVRILSAHQAQGEEWAYVAVPFMTVSEWPQSRTRLALLSPELLQSLGLSALSPQADNSRDEAMLLATALCRATKQVVITTHLAEEDVTILPSPFFEELMETAGGELSDQYGLGWLYAPESPILAEAPLNNYEGNGLWATLSVGAEGRLFDETDELVLSATSVNTYMKCPRLFYYRHLLNLPQESSDAALIGSLIHRVLEIFNRQFGKQPYTSERLQELAAMLFDAARHEEAIENGFKPRDLENLRTLSPIRRVILQCQLVESIDDLARKGYFRDYADAQRIEAEKSIGHCSIPGLDGCVLTGKIDALIQHADGLWDVLDYKTTQGRWAGKPESCERNLQNILLPLPDEEGLSHDRRFFQSDSRPRDYQLPLYYLALKDDYPIRSVALQLVRPRFPDAPEQGAIRIGIEEAVFSEAIEQVVSDLKRFIVDPIRESRAFAMNPDRHCLSCSYQGICDTRGEAE